MDANQNDKPSSALKKPAKKKMLVPIIAIVGGIVLIVVTVIVLLMMPSSSKVSCTQEKTMSGAKMSTTTDVFLSGGKIEKLDSVATVDLSSMSTNVSDSQKDKMVDYFKSYFKNSSVSLDGDIITIKEVAESNDDGKIDSNFIKLYGSTKGFTKEDVKEKMEKLDYKCE